LRKRIGTVALSVLAWRRGLRGLRGSNDSRLISDYFKMFSVTYTPLYVFFAVSKRIESQLGFKLFLAITTNFFEPLGIVIAIHPRCSSN